MITVHLVETNENRKHWEFPLDLIAPQTHMGEVAIPDYQSFSMETYGFFDKSKMTIQQYAELSCSKMNNAYYRIDDNQNDLEFIFVFKKLKSNKNVQRFKFGLNLIQSKPVKQKVKR